MRLNNIWIWILIGLLLVIQVALAVIKIEHPTILKYITPLNQIALILCVFRILTLRQDYKWSEVRTPEKFQLTAMLVGGFVGLAYAIWVPTSQWYILIGAIVTVFVVEILYFRLAKNPVTN